MVYCSLLLCLVVMETNKVLEALRILQQEGREDLIREGVLEQAWVGTKRPKRSSAEGVSAAILACTSPAGSPRKCKKFKAKSVAGRKVSALPERVFQEGERRGDLPGGHPVRRGGIKVPRRSGASFRQRVVALGRGSWQAVAVAVAGQVVAHGVGLRASHSLGTRQSNILCEGRSGNLAVGAHAHKRRRAGRCCALHAQLALEGEGNLQPALKEQTLGGAAIMAAPSGSSSMSNVIEDIFSVAGREDRDDQFYDDIILVIDFDEERAYRPGCDDAHVLGGHETAAAGQRLWRPAVFHGPVEVGAPSGHWVEERAQPGAVRLTSSEVSFREEGYSATNVSGIRSIPASQGATSGLAFEEEALDYEEDDTVARPVAVMKATSSRRVVQGDRLAGGQKVLSGNLLRDEVPNVSGLVGAVSGNKGVVFDNTSNVDVAIQVEDVWGHRRVRWKVCRVLRIRLQSVSELLGAKGHESLLHLDVRVVSGVLMEAVPYG
ncbi:hypothetical protein NDU88_003775 [Pleurodeles waltl]|uniref:Uncharacterized protein n=1 Tax=Pleurodeles waltl TaxID=8319 RepID=A0AAV7MC27_PLEWA|nr:hypothetical protein NDU88_003775 [Pleurodeles waltl]